jgi:DNA polymerase V
VIAVVHGELMVKRLKGRDGSWKLVAENPAYAAIPVDDAGCELWGVVTHNIRNHCNR